jgi:ribosomal protein S6--L-glutamate ligase
VADRFTLGWEEWLALPELGLPAIKAKIDTGAKTSALHAFTVEPLGPASSPMVRFGVHPIPGRDDIEIYCTAEVIDRREVISSNGERETRYVIRTAARMGEREWPIEITLTNRETMAYRMLLGRQAIMDDMVVDPTASFRQPRLSHKVYGARPRENEERRVLRIALLTRHADNPSNRRLSRTVEAHGHTLAVIDRTRASLFVDAKQPAMFVEGRQLEPVDAVIVRAGRVVSSFTIAIVRQLEMLGALALNPADSLSIANDALAVRQKLAREAIPVPEAAVSPSNIKGRGDSDGHVLADSLGRDGFAPIMRFAVIGGRTIAAIEREAPGQGGLDLEQPQWRPYRPPQTRFEGQLAHALAEQAARALGLGIANIDIVTTRQGLLVTDVSPSVSIALFERVAQADVAEAIVAEIEQKTRSLKARQGPPMR